MLDIDQVLEESKKKTENLRTKIDKRKNDERRKEEVKIEKAAKEREDQVEQRRQRIE